LNIASVLFWSTGLPSSTVSASIIDLKCWVHRDKMSIVKLPHRFRYSLICNLAKCRFLQRIKSSSSELHCELGTLSWTWNDVGWWNSRGQFHYKSTSTALYYILRETLKFQVAGIGGGTKGLHWNPVKNRLRLYTLTLGIYLWQYCIKDKICVELSSSNISSFPKFEPGSVKLNTFKMLKVEFSWHHILI